MAGCPSNCPLGIPERLHPCGREIRSNIDQEDWIYVRHPKMPDDEPYGLTHFAEFHVEDQSGNSELINHPNGRPSDVFYNTRYGGRYENMQFAVFPVSEILSISVPHEKVLTFKKGVPVKELDKYTFDLVHCPDTHMYPHCEIRLRKNDQRLGTCSNKIAKGYIRAAFATLAEKYRIEARKRIVEDLRTSHS